MTDEREFSDLLRWYLDRAKSSLGRLAALSDIRKGTIQNWVEGTSKPREWDRVVRMARVLALSESEASEFLQSAGHPPIPSLLAIVGTEQERELLAPWAKGVVGRFEQALSLVVQRRIEADHWKRLHETCQKINFELVRLHGIIISEEGGDTLRLLETEWRLSCSDSVSRFVTLDCIPDAAVRQALLEAEERGNWLKNLQHDARRVDELVDECVEEKDLGTRIVRIASNLFRLALRSCQLLEFLDDRLHRTLRELEQDLENAREHFTGSRIFVETSS